MFCHFWQKFENSKWPPFLGRGKFLGKLQRLHSLDTLWVENFDEIALSGTVKEIEANLCFAIFGKNSKWPPFLGRGKFFENYQEYNAQLPCGSKILTKSQGKIFFKLPRVQCSDTLWVENFNEIALSGTVKEIEANLCFAIFGKNLKIQNGRHFWGGENFF